MQRLKTHFYYQWTAAIQGILHLSLIIYGNNILLSNIQSISKGRYKFPPGRSLEHHFNGFCDARSSAAAV